MSRECQVLELEDVLVRTNLRSCKMRNFLIAFVYKLQSIQSDRST